MLELSARRARCQREKQLEEHQNSMSCPRSQTSVALFLRRPSLLADGRDPNISRLAGGRSGGAGDKEFGDVRAAHPCDNLSRLFAGGVRSVVVDVVPPASWTGLTDGKAQDPD